MWRLFKQRKNNLELIVKITFKHWTQTQNNYSTFKKEILSTVHIDSKSVKEILQKDVKNRVNFILRPS